MFQNPYAPLMGQQNQQFYNQPYQQQIQNIQQEPQNLIRVNGIEGARAYNMPPNSTVALFDGNEDIMYIKTTDGAGYYDIDANVSVAATATGNITATLFKDGAPVQGATAIATAGAVGDVVTLPISALVRLNCDCDTANLTIVIGGQAVTAQNLAFVVEKI